MRNELMAIALHQPHAAFISVGAKKFETRHWPMPHWAIGIPIALHAAKKKITHDEMSCLVDEILIAQVEGDSVMQARCRKAWDVLHTPSDMDYGAIIGVMVLGEEIPANMIHGDPFGDFSEGRWAWPIISYEKLIKPVPTIGRQKWWKIPDPRLIARGNR